MGNRGLVMSGHCLFYRAMNLRLAGLLLVLSLGGCAAIEQHRLKGPGWYLVKPTDTLYSIAWRYGLDYRELARWNGLQDPYLIHPGQQLILLEPDEVVVSQQPNEMDSQQPVVITKASKNKQKPLTRPAQVTQKTKASNTQSPNTNLGWIWPTEGKIVTRFAAKQLDRRGIDIAGKIGQPVYAVAAGKVVYSGTGLAGYGNLIIVKHNNTYLSAYAYNQSRQVKEGEQVNQGTLIAKMGQGREQQASLHFQIRKNGKPVDPLQYLPRQ